MVQGWAADVQIFCFESRIWWMMLRKLAKTWCRLAEFHWQLARAKLFYPLPAGWMHPFQNCTMGAPELNGAGIVSRTKEPA